MIDMKRFMLACMALLAVTACEDEIDKQRDEHAGEVHATATELHSVEVTSAVFEAAVYGDNITERGVCWTDDAEGFPTLEDSFVKDASTGAGAFTAVLGNLEPKTTYHARAYAIRGEKTYFSSDLTFTTADVVTATLGDITPDMYSISVSGSVAGGADYWDIEECGVAYGTAPNPTVNGKKVAARVADRGDFTVILSNLEQETKYYLRAYATCEGETYYSAPKEVTTLSATGLFYGPLRTAGLQYGIVRKDNTFVMHYTFDIETDQVTITYIEPGGNRDAKHVTKAVSFNTDYTKATWDAVSNDGVTFSGISISGTTISAEGTADIALDPSMSATDIYAMYVNSNYGGISRVSELHRGNYHGSVPESIYAAAGNLIEYNGSSGGFITCPGAYLLFKNKVDGNGRPIIPVTEDVATFSFGEFTFPYGGSLTDEKKEEVKTGLAPLTNILYDTDGVIVIKDVKDGKTPTDGDYDVWMITKKDNKWLKWYLRRNGA